MQVEVLKKEMNEAFGLFDPPLEKCEVIWEHSMDTKCLLAWSPKAIALAFRGTASMANVLSDIKVSLPYSAH